MLRDNFPVLRVVEERADVAGVARARLGHGIRLLLHDAHGDAGAKAELSGDGAAHNAAAHDEVVIVWLCHDHLQYSQQMSLNFRDILLLGIYFQR